MTQGEALGGFGKGFLVDSLSLGDEGLPLSLGCASPICGNLLQPEATRSASDSRSSQDDKKKAEAGSDITELWNQSGASCLLAV